MSTISVGNEISGYGALVIALLCALVLAKTLHNNGIFCLTPCGPHACIVDTNRGNAATMRALAILREELAEHRDVSPPASANDDTESQASNSVERNPDESLAERVRASADLITAALNDRFSDQRVRSCAIS